MRRPCLGAWVTGPTVPRPPSSAQSPPPPGSLPCFSVRGPPPAPSHRIRRLTSRHFRRHTPHPPTPAPFKPHRLQLPQLLSRRDGLRPQPGVPSPASARLPLQVSAQKTPRAPSRPSEPALPGHRRPPRPSADWGLGRQRLPREEGKRGAKLTTAPARAPHWLGRPAPARRQGYGQLPGRDRYSAGDPARRRPPGSLGLCAETPECPRAAAPGGEAAPAWPLWLLSAPQTPLATCC